MISKQSGLPEGFCGLPYVRIKALYNTKFAEMFTQTVNEEITAVFASPGGNGYSLCAKENADFSELDLFFKMVKAEVFCETSVAEKLNYKKCITVSSLKLEGFKTEKISHGKISDIYEILTFGSDGDIKLPPFDSWYPDFCLRYNRLAAEYSIINGAAAVCGFMTDEASLITGVATEKDKRGSGLGTVALRSLCTAIKEKYKNSEIFVTATDSAKKFYIKNGFREVGKVAILTFFEE